MSRTAPPKHDATMRPLSELAPLAAGLRGIFTDIDDTLTERGVLVGAAYGAIERARTAGLRLIPVTGRPAGWAEVLASLWPVDAVIAENGAVAVRVTRDEEGRPRVERRYFTAQADRVEHQRRLQELRQEVLARIPFARLAEDQILRATDVAFDIGESQRLSSAEIAQIAAVVAEHRANVIVSTVHLHAFYDAPDKAQMLVRLAGELWGETPDQIRRGYAFIGDSPNDQAGFRFFEHSVGVANVARFAGQLSPPPRWVTDRSAGHGFVELVDLLLAARPATRR